MPKGEIPTMFRDRPDLPKEWKRFKQHCELTFKGPLASKSEVEKVSVYDVFCPVYIFIPVVYIYLFKMLCFFINDAHWKAMFMFLTWCV